LAFTAAGLICTSHSYLSLYDSKAADNAACLASLALASATGVMRIVSDNHYLSDVAAGTAVGLLAGFVLPRYLHFGFSDKSKKTGMTRKGILTPAYVGDDKTAAPGLACHVWF
ncbi:MAG TPA: hypothetical protein DCS07_07580, partial [Bdellovibrionales bacterium]|nr:hypothetical protein [Bdellovibrionales bacterium]